MKIQFPYWVIIGFPLTVWGQLPRNGASQRLTRLLPCPTCLQIEKVRACKATRLCMSQGHHELPNRLKLTACQVLAKHIDGFIGASTDQLLSDLFQ